MTACAGCTSASISACDAIAPAARDRQSPAPMKPTLQFRLSQHLTLTPQLQQSIRLLQLSTVELNQEIERMLMDNPILEREDAESEGGYAPPRDAAAPGAAAEAAPEGVRGEGSRILASSAARVARRRGSTIAGACIFPGGETCAR